MCPVMPGSMRFKLLTCPLLKRTFYLNVSAPIRHTYTKKNLYHKGLYFLYRRSSNKANTSTIRNKSHVHVTWAGTFLLGNEIKRQLLSKEEMPSKAGERGEWGEGFCPARKLKPSQANWVQVLLVGKSRPINLVYYSVAVSLTEGHLGIQ